MKYTNGKNRVKGALVALLAVTLTAGPSLALELAAVPAQWSPDGGTTQIPIWGFVDPSPATAATYVCPAEPVAWNGGPRLDAAPGPLTINVKNCLSADISVFIPGLAKAAGDPLAPQTTLDADGRERLTSLDKTVIPGSTGAYSWTATEGTYLYQSGTDIRTQVPMGLYGALVVSGAGYPAVAQDEVLLFSEIDPLLNANPAGFGGARVSNWVPQYFLINGVAYNPANPPVTIDVSTDVLLRFVNAGLETFAPTFGGGLYMDVIAEDGNLYLYPLTQYGIELTAGKTFDAIVNVGSEGTYPLYDRAGHLTNGGLVVNFQAGVAVGAPTVVDDAYSVAEDGILTADGVAPNLPGVLGNDTDAAMAVLVSGPSSGALTLAVDGSFTYTPNADFSGNDQFTYVANDGLNGPNSNVATATITVTPVNDAPVAAADNTATSVDTAVVINVVANDTDVDNNLDATSVSITVAATNGVAVSNGDGTVTYTPNTGTSGVDNFDYQVCDTDLLCASATVTVDVSGVAANELPIANDDTTSTPRNTPLVNYDIIANDEDPDGTLLASSIVIITGTTSQLGGTVVNNLNGTITYTPPNPGFRGTDTFQYTVNDNDGATSNPATVRINVVR